MPSENFERRNNDNFIGKFYDLYHLIAALAIIRKGCGLMCSEWKSNELFFIFFSFSAFFQTYPLFLRQRRNVSLFFRTLFLLAVVSFKKRTNLFIIIALVAQVACFFSCFRSRGKKKTTFNNNSTLRWSLKDLTRVYCDWREHPYSIKYWPSSSLKEN